MRAPAIASLGMSPVGKVYGSSAPQFADQAVRAAVDNAGLELSDLDGLLVSGGITTDMGATLQHRLGLPDLKLLTYMQGFGSTAIQMVQYASLAVQSGMADTVAVVWADDPLKPNVGAAQSYADSARAPAGFREISRTGGALSATHMYALAARRHMDTYGTTSEQFGAVAVAQRKWAALNPLAQFTKPMTIDDHQASRMISEPFHLLDCCMVSNGAAAVIVTTEERAKSLKLPAVRVAGWAQSHPGENGRRSDRFGLTSGAAIAGPAALDMAGLSLDDIDIVELYDCYTYTVILTLEDYGFCKKGEGGPFVEQNGLLGPDGSLKLNTGGGQLSSYYLWGMTPLSEAIMQAQGLAGDRQVDANNNILVSGNGGILDFHSTLVLSST